MDKKSSTLLRLLLNRYHKREGKSFLAPLPAEEIEDVLSISIESENIAPLFKQPEDEIKTIHYSWLLPDMRNIEKEKLSIILSLFPKSYSLKLSKALSVDYAEVPFTSKGKAYFLQRFYNRFVPEDVLLLEYVPDSEMKFLADLSKTMLVDLIDFLGIYDLAQELPHVVNKHLLEQIYAVLNKKKAAFLKTCLQKKEKLVTQRLRLEEWAGDVQKLKRLLHHKGIIRLGYALSGQHKDLVWHISHILDTGRGQTLSRYCSKEPLSGITDVLKKQVHSVYKFLQQASES